MLKLSGYVGLIRASRISRILGLRIQSALLFVSFTLLFLVASCASGPELSDYPRTQINRPYTLPDGVASWSIPTSFGYQQNEVGESEVTWPIPLPIFWDRSLSENWQISIYPLPSILSHQFYYDSTGYAGFVLGAGIAYSTLNEFSISPTLKFDYRDRRSTSIAIDYRMGVSPRIFLSGYPSEWVVEARVAPLYQFSPLSAITFGPSFQVGILEYVSIAPNQSKIRETRFGVMVPLEVKFLWSFDRQWDLNLGFRTSFLGEIQGAKSFLGTIQFTHFW